jgi:hypothetical protein
MEGQQRQKASGSRKRRHKAPRNIGAPVLIVARRPDAPFTARATARSVAASAEPTAGRREIEAQKTPKPKAVPAPGPRRSARIIQTLSTEVDDQEKLRQRLLQRLVSSEGRLAISNAANELWSHQFEAPQKQELQLQLLEHFDETRARQAIDSLAALLEREPPIKRPILEQRLRRMEEHAEEAATRDAARALRRALRS